VLKNLANEYPRSTTHKNRSRDRRRQSFAFSNQTGCRDHEFLSPRGPSLLLPGTGNQQTLFFLGSIPDYYDCTGICSGGDLPGKENCGVNCLKIEPSKEKAFSPYGGRDTSTRSVHRPQRASLAEHLEGYTQSKAAKVDLLLLSNLREYESSSWARDSGEPLERAGVSKIPYRIRSQKSIGS
jgi:hypothetical protein